MKTKTYLDCIRSQLSGAALAGTHHPWQLRMYGIFLCDKEECVRGSASTILVWNTQQIPL